MNAERKLQKGLKVLCGIAQALEEIQRQGWGPGPARQRTECARSPSGDRTFCPLGAGLHRYRKGVRGRCAKDDIISQSCPGYCVPPALTAHAKAALCLSHCYIRTPSYTLGANLSSRRTRGVHSSLHSNTRSHSEWLSGMELESAAVSSEIWHP